MNIAEQNSAQIERLKTIIANAFTKCSAKKATMPTDRKIANLPDCIDSIVVPSGTKPEVITTNGEHNVKEYEFAQVNVPIPDGYVNFTHYYTNSYTQTANTLETSHTFNCGFKPKAVLISLNTDTTLTTVNGIAFAFRSNIDGLTSVGDGLYKLSTTNRLGSYGGGLSVSAFTDTGFSYSHGSIGFAKGVTYDIYAWG